MNGYAAMHPLELKVRADTLETIAGYPDDETLDRELAFAIGSIDVDDPETMRWACALMAERVYRIEYDETIDDGTGF